MSKVATTPTLFDRAEAAREKQGLAVSPKTLRVLELLLVLPLVVIVYTAGYVGGMSRERAEHVAVVPVKVLAPPALLPVKAPPSPVIGVAPVAASAPVAALPKAEPVQNTIYAFGVGTPIILASPLQVSDVSLQMGEKIKSIRLGDEAHWRVGHVFSGVGKKRIPHLTITPVKVGSSTFLTVVTTRRSYLFLLQSVQEKFMERVFFTYPKSSLSSDGNKKHSS